LSSRISGRLASSSEQALGNVCCPLSKQPEDCARRDIRQLQTGNVRMGPHFAMAAKDDARGQTPLFQDQRLGQRLRLNLVR
jgi:hypothetical protein